MNTFLLDSFALFLLEELERQTDVVQMDLEETSKTIAFIPDVDP